jgi:hypothetical protein
MCMYTLVHLLLLATILTCALISASIIYALIKDWVFCTLLLEAYYLKMDQLKVWVHSANTDVVVITETWLRKRDLNTDINLTGYNLFLQDGSSKGGRVTIFTKDHLQCLVVSTKSFPIQFNWLVLSIKTSNRSLLTVAGSYRPPSAPVCTLPALSSLLAPYT